MARDLTELLDELEELTQAGRASEQWRESATAAEQALRPVARLLLKAELLLAEGQRGSTSDQHWRDKVRAYFSQHERGQVIATAREVVAK